MIRIAICDDERNICELLEKYCKKWALNNNVSVSIRCYEDPVILLADYRDDTDIVFLDIQMERMDGLEAAKKLRELGKDVCLFFVTNRQDYAVACYKVRPFSFLLKPVSYEDFQGEFATAIRRVLDFRDSYLTINSSEGISRINIRNIEYIEVSDHRLTFHESDGKSYISYGSISSLEEQLAEHGFFRCHSAFLINQAYIKSVRKTELYLASGKNIPVSKHRRADFLEQIAKYEGTRI